MNNEIEMIKASLKASLKAKKNEIEMLSEALEAKKNEIEMLSEALEAKDSEIETLKALKNEKKKVRSDTLPSSSSATFALRTNKDCVALDWGDCNRVLSELTWVRTRYNY